MKSLTSSQTGPNASRMSVTTNRPTAANTTSAALPRGQPRATSRPTTGSRPSAMTAATKIESSVSSDNTASTTTSPNARTTSSVRTGMTSSTRCEGSCMRISSLAAALRLHLASERDDAADHQDDVDADEDRAPAAGDDSDQE